ncbi:P-loop containing nucleoside triphosphate hydrolase protein [Agrocybe pediades]|nr:P-loop containing nucleoside triphosphate hydrolase protein [Agrocybe pediades]
MDNSYIPALSKLALSTADGDESKKDIKTKSRLKSKKNTLSATTPASGSPAEPEISAYSQQSRFHRETFDASTTNEVDIDLKGVNISINNKELLVDAHLRLKPGVRYGMVGQNGVGKSGKSFSSACVCILIVRSVLMSVMGNNTLIGLPQNVRFLHIAQLEEFTAGRTILDEVLNADAERTRIIEEAKALEGYTSNDSDAALKKIIHNILLSRSQRSLTLAQKIATKRSGQRGHTARQALLTAEADFASLSAQDPATFITDKIIADTMLEIFSSYEALDVEGDVARAKTILRGLGFSDSDLGKEGKDIGLVGELSGGWRMRVMLGKALFVKPDVLLLDEPTNHLDLPAILWLQNHLLNNDEGQTVVIVSHDRNFLSTVTDETIIFKDKKLTYHPGNYDDWERNSDEQRRRKERMLEIHEKKKKHILDTIQKNVQQARSTGDDKRLGQAASRKKKLERMGMERLEDGKRYKESYHGFRAEIVVEEAVRSAPIRLPPPEPVHFPGGSLLQLCEVSFRYKPSLPLVINNVSLDIGHRARIGFLGPNGCGKSTLMNILAGQLKPTNAKGEVRKGHQRLRIGYFSQHTVDQLDLGLSAIQLLMRNHPDVLITEGEARAHYSDTVGLSGNTVVLPLSALSGGQRNRVALGLITFARPHVLLLDEITNHLDMGSVETLVDELTAGGEDGKGWEGAVVVVSHDVWFLKRVVEGVGEDGDNEDEDDGSSGGGGSERPRGVLYTVTKTGSLAVWEKGVDAYVEKIQRMAAKRGLLGNRSVK